ncbi:hypothetical protein CRENBAI_013465 [Crenichthys baileyi]|uniref:Fibronectin type-III domain-containing protein n=1 Tax=Crenichthys baileyi TaxID=28760 RepID=A0AAV9SIF6_9TELE
MAIPPNAEGFKAVAQSETSITLQWNKVNNNTSFVLQFNGTETFISAPDGDGPVNHTVSSLTAGANYLFTLYSVLNNIRSSGISITAATAERPSSCADTGCPSGTECITRNGAVQCLDPCDSYTVLNDTWRSINNNDRTALHCDRYIAWNGWYRFFLGQSSAQIPGRCIEEHRCGTDAPLWIVGTHPNQFNEIVTRTVCVSGGGTCCYVSSHTIQIKLCYGYYVYKLQQPFTCDLAYCAEPQGFSVFAQNENSISLQWFEVNTTSFVLQYNGTETNISAADGDGTVFYTVSSLTAGTKYTFTLFSVSGDVRSSGEQLTAVTAPLNAEGLTKLRQDETSITLQWNKINNDTSFVLQFYGRETFISAPDGDGPVTHTVSSLSAGNGYTFTLFSVFENVKSRGVSITAVTVPRNPFIYIPTYQDETSITLWLYGLNNYFSHFVLQFNGTETFISASYEYVLVAHTVSSLTAGTRYMFTLFSVFGNLRSSGVSIVAATAPKNTDSFRQSEQNETSITLQWNRVNNDTSFVLQFNGTETFISSSGGDGPVTHTVSSLTAGARYIFTLFSVFENVRSRGFSIVAATVPPNAHNFRPSELDETSITLQWNKVNYYINFVLQFNGTETFISAPYGDGPVYHTVSSLTARTRYTFTLFSVSENVRSSGVNITAVTGPKIKGSDRNCYVEGSLQPGVWENHGRDRKTQVLRTVFVRSL